ncbi:MAG: TetR/AcrR family transcriptional regulator [bacterium]
MITANKTISPVIPPRRRRGQETLERFLDATETVIREEGIAELTVTKVVKKAGSSVGAFYRRFPDRDALLYAVQERNHARAIQAYDAQLAKLKLENASLEEILETLLFFRARLVLRDAALVHAFLVKGALRSAFQEEGRRFFAGCWTTLTQVLMSHRDLMGHPEPELALEVVCRTWLALMEQVVLYGDSPFDTPVRTSDTELLVAEYCRAMAAYLRSEGVTGPHSAHYTAPTDMPA